VGKISAFVGSRRISLLWWGERVLLAHCTTKLESQILALLLTVLHHDIHCIPFGYSDHHSQKFCQGETRVFHLGETLKVEVLGNSVLIRSLNKPSSCPRSNSQAIFYSPWGQLVRVRRSFDVTRPRKYATTAGLFSHMPPKNISRYGIRVR